jgi:hypothetical protein
MPEMLVTRPDGPRLCDSLRSEAAVAAGAHAEQAWCACELPVALFFDVDLGDGESPRVSRGDDVDAADEDGGVAVFVDVAVEELHLSVAVGAGAQLRDPLRFGADLPGEVHEGEVVVKQIGEAVDLTVGRLLKLLGGERADLVGDGAGFSGHQLK